MRGRVCRNAMLIAAATILLAQPFALTAQQASIPPALTMQEQALFEGPSGPVYTLIKQVFPDAFAAYAIRSGPRGTAQDNDGEDPAESAFSAGQIFLETLRRDNARYLKSAPLEDLRAVQVATLAVLHMLESSPPKCAAYAAFGASVTQLRETEKLDMTIMNRALLLSFQAIRKGRDHPVSNPVPQTGDRAQLIADWAAKTAPSSGMVWAVRNRAWSHVEFCAAAVSLQRYVVQTQSPLADRILVATLGQSVSG